MPVSTRSATSRRPSRASSPRSTRARRTRPRARPVHRRHRRVVHRLAADDARIRSSRTPAWTSPSASTSRSRPAAIRSSSGSTPTPNSRRATPSAASPTSTHGAASLGGIMVATGRPGFQAAVAHAYNSRFGLGGASYHGEHAAARARGVRVHGHHADVRDRDRRIRRDPAPRRGLGAQLPAPQGRAPRLARPGLRVSYWPRNTWNKLARQFRATGIWRGELVRRLGAMNPLRFFAPPILLVNLVVRCHRVAARHRRAERMARLDPRPRLPRPARVPGAADRRGHHAHGSLADRCDSPWCSRHAPQLGRRILAGVRGAGTPSTRPDGRATGATRHRSSAGRRGVPTGRRRAR